MDAESSLDVLIPRHMPEKIKAYIQLSLAICNYAMIAGKVSPKEKELGHDLARMRNWMTTLGLVGEEYKTARYHLTRYLVNKDDNKRK